ncbi:putative thiazole-containing bacteriocin maturation protein [Bacillus sp. T33-2]|uniref:putative thiazole-containing bacteriocin maturation protein n=1 Tax=Bacillus sp. T33-2 TaxID=2054168 RepID=UPI000C764B54|nr:putative thiazole-containing bacteriocin maturation protein [Bacillus sp. T33-2]PLR89831.1 putative thiazole-containing bacteriocin maturation protein [Bacillus sp. T33-2]
MTNLTPSMRLKLKRDTFFLPDPNSGVYFRNNLSSFRMEGSSIDKWVEKLMPMFNGEYTLAQLTDGLPGPYRDRVYEIAGVLYRNGFVQDMSQDRPHHLSEQILKRHASQIEFLESFGGSAAYRFQTYRHAKVLAVGSGSFLVSLVAALIESGLPKFHILITDSVSTSRRRVSDLMAYASETDPEAAVEEIILENHRESSWEEIVQPFDAILYVSQEGEIEELRVLHSVCRKEKKIFLPAICLQQVGLAGPLVHPDFEGCWESAWRRIHETTIYGVQQLTSHSSIAGAMMSNVIVFEFFKHATKTGNEVDQKNKFFLLDLETMEGNWHSFLPHPLVAGDAYAKWVEDFDLRLEQEVGSNDSNQLFLFFSQLTSSTSGIFHIWEEGDLKQLPLAQCRVQAVDPLAEGPADLLPDIVCSGLTHEEARMEAAFAGIEAYVSRLGGLPVKNLPSVHIVEGIMVQPKELVGVGSGVTFAEAICRGLQRCLDDGLKKQQANQKNSISLVQLNAIEDERCLFYLQALTTMQGAPMIGLGDEVCGLPVVWIGTNYGWYSSAGLNITLALRKALQQALLKAQNQAEAHTMHELEVSTVHLAVKEPASVVIPVCEDTAHTKILQSALDTLKRNGKRLFVFEHQLEPSIKQELAGAFSVLLREEETG